MFVMCVRESRPILRVRGGRGRVLNNSKCRRNV